MAEKDWIALVKEFVIEQSSGIKNNIFYAEDVGGVKYEFVLEFPDNIPTKTGISGSEIIDVNKTLDDTIVNVQRVFPDGEVIVDYSFNAKGKGGDVQALDNFNKILKEGKGMKGVLLEYYDTFPVKTTIPTTLENDITIPNTLESIDTPTNVVGDNYIKGSSNGPSRTDKILIETLEDFASYSKIPFSDSIEILKENQQGVKISKELGYTEDGFLYLYNSIDGTYQYVDPKDTKKLKLFLQENNLIDFLYTNQLYVPFQIDVDKEILTRNKIFKLPDIPVNHITEGAGIIRNLKEKYPNELLDLDVDFDNVDGGRINIQSLFIDSDLKEKEIYENVINQLNELSNKYNVFINNYDDNPIHNFYNIIDTPTNVVDDLITKDVLNEAIEEAFDELEGLRLAGELPGNATHGLFTRELLNVLEAKGFDIDNPENIKRLDNWALNSGFSDVKSFSDLIIADVKEPTLVQSAYPGNYFDNDLNIIRKAEPLDTIFTENVNKNVIKNEIFNDRSSLDENTIEYLKKNTDTPTNVVGDEFVDNIVNANTQLVNNLPLSETVKNQFDNVVRNRAKNLATPGGVIDAVDVWEMGVLGLMITAIAYKEFDEIPTIFKRTATNMFNSMTSMYNIPPVPLEQYDLDYEFIEKVITTGEKVMPTDIIIKKVGEIAKGVGEKGLATGFGYVPTTPKNTDTMETTQKIQPGVQEEKMFEQLRPKKIKSAGGSGARIQ